MEFVNEKEVFTLLRDLGIERTLESEDRVELSMQSDDSVVHVHLSCDESKTLPADGVDVITIEKQRLPVVVEHILHQLRLSQILLVPVGKWRNIFDLVAFSLAENESWQEVDAAATVELNQRDPLLCEPVDFPTLNDLLIAFFQNADNPDQGLMLVSTVTPLLIEIIPDGALRISIGNQVLADEVAEAFAVS